MVSKVNSLKASLVLNVLIITYLSFIYLNVYTINNRFDIWYVYFNKML